MVCAVLNARSVHQLTEVVTAACRRAGIAEMMEQPPQPQQAPQQQEDPQQDHQVNQPPQGVEVQTQPMVDSLAQHTRVIHGIFQYIQNQPNNQDFVNMMATLQMQNQSQIEAIAGLAAVLARLEQRLQEWERLLNSLQPERVPYHTWSPAYRTWRSRP